MQLVATKIQAKMSVSSKVASRAASRAPNRVAESRPPNRVAESRPPNRVATPMVCHLDTMTKFFPCTAHNERNSLATKASRGKDAVVAKASRGKDAVAARGLPHQQCRPPHHVPMERLGVDAGEVGRQRRSGRRKNGERRIIDVGGPNTDKVDQYYFVGTKLFQVQEKQVGAPTVPSAVF
jgi:hypothetical protein